MTDRGPVVVRIGESFETWLRHPHPKPVRDQPIGSSMWMSSGEELEAGG